jgi:hypothetical protein
VRSISAYPGTVYFSLLHSAALEIVRISVTAQLGSAVYLQGSNPAKYSSLSVDQIAELKNAGIVFLSSFGASIVAQTLFRFAAQWRLWTRR